MQEFMQKWNSDPRFKTKVQLSLYTLFVIFVAIFALSGNRTVNENNTQNQTQEENNSINKTNDDNNNKDNNIETIEIPTEYNYKINITINETNYKYTGEKNTIRQTLTKTVDNIDTNYIYENNSYYKEVDTENYILTTKEDVYDVVEYSYIDLNTINQYLSKSIKVENINQVYLKDIILGNDSEDYITIIKENNKIKIDYTELAKYFDKNITKYLIEIEIIE